MIDEQVIALSASTEEQWKKEHREAMACQDVQDAVAVSLSLWDIFQARLQSSTAKDEDPMPLAAEARQTATLFANLFPRILRAAEAFEQKAHKIQGIDRARSVYHALKVGLSVDLNRLESSHAHARHGNTRSLGDIRRDLQRRMDS